MNLRSGFLFILLIILRLTQNMTQQQPVNTQQKWHNHIYMQKQFGYRYKDSLVMLATLVSQSCRYLPWLLNFNHIRDKGNNLF